jgi:hypothetical protein
VLAERGSERVSGKLERRTDKRLVRACLAGTECAEHERR